MDRQLVVRLTEEQLRALDNIVRKAPKGARGMRSSLVREALWLLCNPPTLHERLGGVVKDLYATGVPKKDAEEAVLGAVRAYYATHPQIHAHAPEEE